MYRVEGGGELGKASRQAGGSVNTGQSQVDRRNHFGWEAPPVELFDLHLHCGAAASLDSLSDDWATWRLIFWETSRLLSCRLLESALFGETLRAKPGGVRGHTEDRGRESSSSSAVLFVSTSTSGSPSLSTHGDMDR
ncbi:hypothetical protein EYF80_002710 [Liparis tanakae]|uniref:Uncharacterized protein n=1 Tax=Liparis tanakae TaxID=230148 RepID=A0A4Z2J9C6_9TELE|nr:hypothetical protein EYF80_002710 [Liparis tanakae]